MLSTHISIVNLFPSNKVLINQIIVLGICKPAKTVLQISYYKK